MNFSGKIYHAVAYGLTSETERIDYDEVRELAPRTQAQTDRGRLLGLSARH